MDIVSEQNQVRENIIKIKEYKVFHKIKDCLNQFKDSVLDPLHSKNINIHGRLKKVDSAVNKIAQKNIPASEIYDLLAYMIVVDLPENYEFAKQELQTRLPGVTFLHDFDGSLPENNGYSSFHLGVNLDSFFTEYNLDIIPELQNLPAEVQLKSYGMYMAQECTHDSIYKNNDLTQDQKQKMQSLMFPMIEYLTDIEMYQNALNATVDEQTRSDYESKILSRKQKIEAHKAQYADYINENMEQIEAIFREYVARKYIEDIKSNPDSELSMEENEKLIAIMRKAISHFAESQSPEQLSDTEPTGFKNIDELLSNTKNIEFGNIEDSGHKSENKPNLLKNAISASEKFITAIDMKAMFEIIHGHSISSHSHKTFTNER